MSSELSITWRDFGGGRDFAGAASADFDAKVDHYLWGLAPDEEVTIRTTRRNALFYGLLAQEFMRWASPEGGSPHSPYQELHRLGYVLNFAAWHGLSVDVDNRGWSGSPTGRAHAVPDAEG